MEDQKTIDNYKEDQPVKQTSLAQAKKPKLIKLLLAGVLIVSLALLAILVGNSMLGIGSNSSGGGSKKMLDQRVQQDAPSAPSAQPHN
ncbi:MAG: hypothetical protein FWF88_10690 [Peptococcaceae bacterium]|nr:hypothetical protein [Peptococcaceae bacterium]